MQVYTLRIIHQREVLIRTKPFNFTFFFFQRITNLLILINGQIPIFKNKNLHTQQTHRFADNYGKSAFSEAAL